MTLKFDVPSTVFGFGVTADNVNEALPMGLDLVKAYGRPVVSRGVETLEVPGPVITTYRNPCRRVLFDEVRDANPFFHLIEALWVLSGDNGVALPARFLGRYKDFSDNGTTLHGAYGYRMRYAFGVDQLLGVVKLLRERPDTRQAVVSIWDPRADLGTVTKDMPCNDMIMFSIRDNQLHMTVNCRSNDVIWGAYGANAVQFSVLQEWVAAMVGVEVGYYTQFSNSFHVYPDNPFWKEYVSGNHDSGHVFNHYMSEETQPYPLALNAGEADQVATDAFRMAVRANKNIHLFGTERHENKGPDVLGYHSRFFINVVVPVVAAYEYYQAGDLQRAIATLEYCAAVDWRVACTAWVMRRQQRRETLAKAH